MINRIEINPDSKCIILAPHPDDETIGCGGFLLKYAKNCKVVILTDGSKYKKGDKEEIIKTRFEELKNAMIYANIENYETLMIKDKQLYLNLDRLDELNLPKYDYVFIPNKDEIHIDHSCIYKKVQEILRFSLKTQIVCYEVWSPISNPNCCLDISDIINKKYEMISLYKSQNSKQGYAEKITALNKYRGLNCNTDYAETYFVQKTFLQKLCNLFCFKKTDSTFLIKFLGIKFQHKLCKKKSDNI